MLQELASILKDRIAATGLCQKNGGLVVTAELKQEDQDKKILVKKFPATTDYTFAKGCKPNAPGDLQPFTPDQQYRGICYFEGTEIKRTAKRFSFGNQYEASLRLVVWYNRLHYGFTPAAPSNGQLIAILSKALGMPFNDPRFMKMAVILNRTVENAGSIFSQYSYDSAERQFLTPPYSYFAMDLRCSFVSRMDCAITIQNNIVIC